jgi:hypothetical protein
MVSFMYGLTTMPSDPRRYRIDDISSSLIGRSPRGFVKESSDKTLIHRHPMNSKVETIFDEGSGDPWHGELPGEES